MTRTQRERMGVPHCLAATSTAFTHMHAAGHSSCSGLRQRQMSSSEGRNRTATVASAAYGRAVRRWL